MCDSYLLGALTPFIASPTIQVHDKHCNLEQLFKVKELCQSYYKKDIHIEYGMVYSFFLCEQRSEFMNITIPTDEEQKWDYIAGFIDMSSKLHFCTETNDMVLKIFGNPDFLTKLQEHINIPSILHKDTIVYTFTNVIDLFGHLKGRCFKYHTFKNMLSIPTCLVYKRDPSALLPSKSRFSDVGYDIHIIRTHKQLNQTTILYDTGIALNIPYGYYVEIVPRSSLTKTGYMLTNSMGIIDRSYRGNLYIALTKIADDAIDIQFPFRCCQLIFRKQEFMDLNEFSEENVLESTRNMGGFGSTG